MTYLIEPDRVLWKERPLKQADATTFEIFGPRDSSILARDKSHVYVLGKPAKVNAASFRPVGSHHAVDKDAAYFVMATKLKPIPKADPGTFVALGENYGKDDQSAFFGAKRVRLKTKAGGSLPHFRDLDRNFATDGAWMYFGTAQVDPPKGVPLDWSAARYLPFEDNQINMSSGVLSDGRRHFLHDFRDHWVELPDLDPDRIQCMGTDTIRGWHSKYVTDGSRVFFHGEELTAQEGAPAAGPGVARTGMAQNGIAPNGIATPQQLGPDVVAFRGSIWCGLEETDLPSEGLAYVGGDHYRLGDQLLEIQDQLGVRELARRDPTDTLPPQAALTAALDSVLPTAASLFDRYLPLEDAPGDMELDVPAPGGTPSFEVVAIKDGTAEIRVEGGVIVSGPADGLVTLCCLVWAASRGRRDRHLVFINHSTSYPDVDRLQMTLASRDPGPWLRLASSLHAAGEEPRGQLLAHLVMHRIRRREPLAVDLLKGLPLALAGGGLYRERKWDIEKTTNLGIVKHVAGLGLLTDPDVRVQLEMVNTLAGAVSASHKSDQTLKHAVPALLDALDGLDSAAPGVLREAIWAALDICTVAATVHAEMGRGYAYTMLEAASAKLVSEGVNVDIQRVRLAEALWGQGRDGEARALEDALLAEVPRDLPCPGAYKYRVRFTSFRGALLAARMRSLPARQPKAPALAEARDELQGQLEELARAKETPGAWAASPDELDLLEGLLGKL